MKRINFNIKDKKMLYMVLGVLMVSVLTLTVAYAALGTILDIKGNAQIVASNWNIHLENPVVNSQSATDDKPVITGGNSLTFTTILNMPGDFYEFTVDVVNSGDIDAMIESITKTPELTETQAKYLKYEITYQNGESITKKQNLKAKSTMPIKVRLEYRTDLNVSDLPASAETLTFSITLNYIQSDGTGSDVKDNGIGNLYNQTAIFPTLKTDFDSNDIASSTAVNIVSAPFVYNDLNLFSGKTITKIGIPVKSVTAIDENQTFTLYVLDKINISQGKTTTARSTYTLTLPISQISDATLSNGSYIVNDWVYIDLTEYNIKLSATETLGFSATTDTAKWGYQHPTNPDLNIGTQYEFTLRVLTNPSVIKGENIFFDVYVKEDTTTPSESYEEKAIFSDLTTKVTSSTIESIKTIPLSASPFVYNNLDLFSGETITKIGIPVRTVAALNDNQIFTLYVVQKESLLQKTVPTVTKSYQLRLPLSQLGNSTTVNKWVYVDVSQYNITLDETETLAFSSSTDTVQIGYQHPSVASYNLDARFEFTSKALSSPTILTGENLYFDVYVKEKTPTTTTIKTILNNKNLSILGDSISTFTGYSNNSSTTNSNIGSNAVYYTGSNIITNINDTWWKQAARQTGLNILVNNSYSGDTIGGRGLTRAAQLHDNTGINAGTNPDIIAVYFGINDVKAGLEVETFASSYNQLVSKIQTTYPNAEIFIFTHVPYIYNNGVVQNVNDTLIETYNAKIRAIANASTTDKVHLVDYYAHSGITYNNCTSYMGDVGLHPNAAGMDKITAAFVNALELKYLNN